MYICPHYNVNGTQLYCVLTPFRACFFCLILNKLMESQNSVSKSRVLDTPCNSQVASTFLHKRVCIDIRR